MSTSDYLSLFGRFVSTVDAGWKELAKMLSFVHEDIGVIQRFPLVVKQYYLDALLSFLSFNFIASILASSESVEAAINRDPRMRFDPINEWHELTPKSLKLAKTQGLPVEKLLINTDDLERGKVDFLTFRNKFGHGDIHITRATKGRLILLETAERKKGLQVSMRDTPGKLLVARQQLELAHRFLSDLHKNSEPEWLVVADMRKMEDISPEVKRKSQKRGDHSKNPSQN